MKTQELGRSSTLRLASAALILALVAACGGGGGGGSTPSAGTGGATSGGTTGTTTGGTTAGGGTTPGGTDPNAGVGVGGTGAYSVGPISGFGSIIVNGVRYDDSTAKVFDDNGGLRTKDELKLGMKVELRASKPTADAAGVMRATATEIRFSREVTGPITAIDTAAGTITVFGVVVKVDNSTVFDGAAGLSALRVGNVVEVYALSEANGTRLATRIEYKATAAANAVQVITGNATTVDATGRRFTIGTNTDTFTFTSASALPAALVVGAEVKVQARATTTAGTYEVVSLQVRAAKFEDGVTSAEVEGFITEYTSMANFKVNGLPVSTSATTKFEGLSTPLAVGVRVEVEGAVTNGVLVATKVEVKKAEDSAASGSGSGSGSGGGSGNSSSDSKFELSGAVASVDAAARSFILRGNTVIWDDATKFDKGTAVQLINGAKVEVKAVRATDATKLRALEIKFDD